MTRSSQTVHAHILDFNDDFERDLRRKRRHPERSEPSSSSEAESEFEEVEEEVMAADNRTIKELSASGLANAAPLCIQYPAAAQGKTDEFELKSTCCTTFLNTMGFPWKIQTSILKSLK